MKPRTYFCRDFILGLALLIFTPGLVLAQDYLTEEQIVLLFGDLNRPADVLLGEAEAKTARAVLCIRLQQHLAIKGMLSELQEAKFSFKAGGTEIEDDKQECLERDLKLLQAEIREVCDKLDSSWLLPVDTGPDDQQYAVLMNSVPQVQVSLRSQAGSLLTPTKLTLSSPTEGSFPFTQVRPGIYIASPPIGEYQLGWQLTDKSIVQRTRIDVANKGRQICEVILGPPEIQVKTKWQEINISDHQPLPATTELGQPPDFMPK